MKTPRALLAAIGATAVALALAFFSAFAAAPAASAQPGPPDEATRAQMEAARAEMDAARAAAYDEFVAGMATELGVDAAAVDAAIRATLTGIVDDRQAAGDLSLEDAAALKARIGVSETPLLPGMMGAFAGVEDRFGGGPGRHGGFGPGRGGRPHLPSEGERRRSGATEVPVGGDDGTASPETEDQTNAPSASA